MRSRTVLVHVRHSDVSIVLSFFHHLKDFIRRRNESFSNALKSNRQSIGERETLYFNVRNTIFIFVNGEIRFGDIEKIANLVEIDFEVGHFDLKLKISVQRVDMVEDILNDPRNNTLLTFAIHHTLDQSFRVSRTRRASSHLHGVSLAARCLSVGKDRAVVTTENIFDDLFCCFVVDFLLRGIRSKDFVEDVDFTLEETDMPSQRSNEPHETYADQNSFFLIGREFHDAFASCPFFRIVQRTKTSNDTDIAFIGGHRRSREKMIRTNLTKQTIRISSAQLATDSRI